MSEAYALLERRVSRLERTNKGLLLALAGCLAMMLTAAASPPGNVMARAFQLVNDNGAVIAELVARDGYPGFYLTDANGIERVALFHTPDASGLHLMDEHGVTRIGAVQFAHGGGGFALHGPDSKGAAVLYLKQTGSLRFFDDDGNVTNQVLARAPDSVPPVQN